MNFETGISLYKEGKFQEALEVFNFLIEKDDSSTELLLYRGRILSRLGQTENALADFDKIVALEPYNTNFIKLDQFVTQT